jgi:putative spermidine/putrescine transport system substrate-binding protein
VAYNREVDRDQLERHLYHELKKRGLTRRDLMKGGVGMAAALGLGSLFAACGGDSGGDAAPAPAPAPSEPAPAPSEPAPSEPAPAPSEPAPAPADIAGATVRVLGLGVDLIDPIKAAAETALGIKLTFDVTDTITMTNKALTDPGSFDVFSGYHHMYDQIWPSGNLVPVDTSLITGWGQVNNLFKLGKVDPASTTCTYGDGDAPFRKIYVDPDKSGTWKSSPETIAELDGVLVQWADEATGQGVGAEPKFINGVPQNFNMDSVGYNNDVIALEPDKVSWAELFNENYSGRVALLNDPSIALQDAGNAAKALGLLEFQSLGNMTTAEMDGLFKILSDLRKKGHFRAYWSTFDESVALMANGEVVIESMWSPAVALLVTQGVNVRYAAPPEGFRGWSAGQAISAKTTDPKVLAAAYAYINWWHSGEPGAIMMRQGYYNGVQEPSREFVSPAEWDFWIDGKAAAEDLPGITGNVGDVKAGQVRDGGSFVQRACTYSSWNSYFAENEYQIQKWNEFQAS